MFNRFETARGATLAAALALVALAAVVLVPVFAHAATTTTTTTTKAPATAAKPRPKPKAAAAAKAPAATIATVLGKKITREDLGIIPPPLAEVAKGDPAKLKALRGDWENQMLTGLVLGVLLERYGAQHSIAPTAPEVSQVLAIMVQPPPADVKITRAPPDTNEAQVRAAGTALVERFKIHAALWKQYGGRVFIDRQSGPMPFDSYRRLLEAEQKAGAFTLAPAWKTRFWRPFAEDSSRTFVPQAEAMTAMTTPWWLAPAGSDTR